MEKEERKFRIIGKWFLLAFLAPILFVNPAAESSEFPSKPITLIANMSPGGTVDLTARKLADLTSKILGQPVLVENKVGGGGVIGIKAVSMGKPDGYTIGTITMGAAIIPHYRSVPYDTKKDLTFIMQYANFTETFCVRADSRFKTFKDFIGEARKNPRKLSYATAGAMGNQHICMQRIALAEKVELAHVPTSGGAELVTQLLGGHVDAGLAAALSPHLGSGKIRPLAVLAEKRFHLIPDVPTFSELGYKLDPPLWLGLIAPRGLDQRIVKILHDAFKKASDDPSFQDFLQKVYTTPRYRDSESFSKKVLEDFDRQAEIANELKSIMK